MPNVRELANHCLLWGVISIPAIVVSYNPLGSVATLVALGCGVASVAGIAWKSVHGRRLDVRERGWDMLKIAAGMSAACWTIMIPFSGFLEAQVRSKVSTTTRLLVSVETRLLATPADERREFSRKVKMDADPFAKGAPLQLRVEPNGIFMLWGVGPDMTDQKGTLRYDPTNGTVSPGDIVTSGVFGEAPS